MMRLIAAIDSRNGLATESGIPWQLPTDQRFFKDQTATGLLLMGFRTHLEIKKPLHGRTNYVATRRAATLRDGFVPVTDVLEFMQSHRSEIIQNIGGAELFHTTLHLADELLITQINKDFGCTKFFPSFISDFQLATESEPVTENGATFTFQSWLPRRER